MAEENTVWNVGFFVRKLPATRWIRSATFYVFQLPDNVRETLLEIAQEHRELFNFAAPSLERDICLVVARITAKEAGEAVELARHRVGHYLDGISLLLDEPPPMAKVLVLQRSGEADGSFRQFDDKGWVTFTSKDNAELNPWKDSREQLFVRLRPFFVRVLDEGWDQHSELFRQLLFSARLFRRASETASYGLEYLCKWVAIEALTVAGDTKKKGATVAARIAALFPENRETIRAEVADLWQRRHVIAHEAKAEFFGEAGIENAFQLYIPRLDYLNTTVMSFAVDHLGNAATVSELWALTDTWVRPKDIVIERPKGAARWGAEKILLNCNIGWQGIGTTLDLAFAEFK